MSSPPAFASVPSYMRVKDCRYGRMLYNSNDEYVGKSLDLYGEFSEGEVGLFRQLLREGDTVIDAGANIGAHTVYFARAVGPKGSVLAVEPQRLIYQMLCGNAALNGLTNVWTMNCALGETDGSVVVPVLDPSKVLNFGGLPIGLLNTGENMALRRLDSLPVSVCRLIKIDVEGMELEVLKGAANLIQRHRPALYVENDRADKSAALVRHIDSLGYDAYYHWPPLFNSDNFLRNGNNAFGNVVSKNIICLPRGLSADLKDFVKVEVPSES